MKIGFLKGHFKMGNFMAEEYFSLKLQKGSVVDTKVYLPKVISKDKGLYLQALIHCSSKNLTDFGTLVSIVNAKMIK